MQNAAMLWTGGKDSALALHEAVLCDCRVRCLVTFAPTDPDFLAHPLAFIKLQAQALNLPHHVLSIQEPFAQGYETALAQLRDEMNIDAVITGDIAEVAESPNWIRERSRPVGLAVHTPLWGRDRLSLLRQLLDHGFCVRFSCVKTRWLDEDWVGRELDEPAIDDLQRVREKNSLDLCGEEGEYHTLVTDGPDFKRRIAIHSASRRQMDSLAHWEIHKLELVEK